ncbi:hypothetical protein BK665_27445 [Pseudomonas frederiksbergensis]|uniref:Uncharacterized protein n=1 Tax=Pseudomonas frederiksbergensis TaxID=104087 RepID=A0A423K6R7_9PSED|nr:hypothetical protein BK665_27445 [Pseudomonas frederiksbergensis]
MILWLLLYTQGGDESAENYGVTRGASSLTPKQLRDCVIDSQVLFWISLAQCGRGSLAIRYSFDIMPAIEFAAPTVFISLKPKPE